MSESKPDGVDGIRADIEQTRAELADTVDALGDKLDVKGQATAKVSEAKAKVADSARQAKELAPEPVQRALDTAGAKVSPVAHRTATELKPYRKQILAGAAAAVIVFLAVRKRRNAR